MNAEEIQGLIAELAASSSSPVECEETFGAWVLLADEYAYKIKKPLRLSFLDYSSRLRRKRCCELEVALNSRLSPTVYLGVVPVRRAGDTIRLTGSGIVIDHAVQMRRLDRDRLMNRMLEAGRVRNRHIDTIAARVAAFHRSAEAIRDEPLGDILARFDYEIGSIREVPSRLLGSRDQSTLDGFARQATRLVAGSHDLLAARAHQGFVRDGHGDLHSRNIFLYEEPVFFDCIEFNDSLRKIDVMSDLSFCCMDLEAHGAAELSARLQASYCRSFDIIRNEREALLFVYYKMQRACSRLKICARAITQAPDPETADEPRRQFHVYLELIRGYSTELEERNADPGSGF